MRSSIGKAANLPGAIATSSRWREPSPIHSYHLIPYVAAEPFYESQYDKWSTTSLYAGVLLPVGKHVQFDPYYEHDNNTGKHPNQQVNSIGLVLNLFFLVDRN